MRSPASDADPLFVCAQAEAPATVSVDYHARTGINSRDDYEALYNCSIQDPAGFWADFARQFHWEKPVSS